MIEDENLLKRFNEEHDKAYTSPPLPQPMNLQNQQFNNNISNEELNQKNVISELENKINPPQPPLNRAHATSKNIPTLQSSYIVPNAQETVGGLCSECGVIHPPLRAGEKCPNAKTNLPSITDEEIGIFLTNMKNIIISQIEKNKIKNSKKLFQQSIVILAKFLEEYKEEENIESNPTRESKNETS